MIDAKKLQFYLDNNLNVLFVGRHGTAKSVSIINLFNKNNLNWRYFSAPVIDPYIHFIGIPREKVENRNGKDVHFVDLLPPRDFAFDDVEAIFVDEPNRGKVATRQGLLELIQFKSLNGRKFNNLRVVWAAINPEDEKDEAGDAVYDTEKLDPALKDRFHVIYDVPYECDRLYFNSKFGEIGNFAIDWWNDLDEKQKKMISPRRLDYALDLYIKGGDLRDCLPSNVGNISKLISELANGSISSILYSIFKSKDRTKGEEFINKENNLSSAENKIFGNQEMIDFFIPLIKNKEKIIAYANDTNRYDRIARIKELKDTFVAFAKNHPNDTLSFKLRHDGIVADCVLESSKLKEVFNHIEQYSDRFLMSEQDIKDLNARTISGWDVSLNIWTKSKEDREARNELYNTTAGRKKMYCGLIYIRATNNANELVLQNILQILFIIIDRSYHKSIRNELDSFVKFFYTTLHQLKQMGNNNKNTDALFGAIKTYDLAKIDSFVDAFILNPANVSATNSGSEPQSYVVSDF